MQLVNTETDQLLRQAASLLRVHGDMNHDQDSHIAAARIELLANELRYGIGPNSDHSHETAEHLDRDDSDMQDDQRMQS